MFRSKLVKTPTVDPEVETVEQRPESDNESIDIGPAARARRMVESDNESEPSFEILSRCSSTEQIEEALNEMRDTLNEEPLGQAFGHILKELARLKVKGANKSQALETGPICRLLKEHLRVARDQLLRQHETAERVGKLEEQLQRSDESKHFERIYRNPLFATSVEPPTQFGAPEKRPLTFDEAAKLDKLLPRGNQKFSGGKSGPAVIEYLEMLNDVQVLARLNQEEFKQILLRTCTGEAYTEAKAMVEAGYTIPKIYYALEKTYDKSESPLQALHKLDMFKATRDQTSKQVENYIHRMALLASKAYPKGPSRTFQTDILCLKTLLDALPARASEFVRERINDLTVKLDRSPTFSEVSTVLDPHRFFLDSQLASYAKGPARKTGVPPEDRFKSFHGPTYRVNAAYKLPSQTGIRGSSVNGIRRRGAKSSLAPSRARVNQINTQPHRNGGRGGGAVRPPVGASRGGRGAPRQERERKCTLCGRAGHTAAMGCYQMRDDQNRVVRDVTSTWGCCTLSEKCKSLGLRHPEAYCPERPALKKFKK